MKAQTFARLFRASALAAGATLSAPCLAEGTILPLPNAGSFALIGDVPYGATREAQFDRVIADINRNGRVRFVIHTGDIKAGSERCDDDLLLSRFRQYQQFEVPFIFTPGDNEWTDCHRSNNGGYHPLERLDRVREIFYPVPGLTTGGKRARVITQADVAGFELYVENQMWDFAGATFGTIHVVGSNNGLAAWDQIDASDSYDTPRADRVAEAAQREAAALAWIDRIFAHAQQTNARGVLIAMQANPNFELPESDRQRQGFNAVLASLAEHAIVFGRPVLIAHGDSHYFRVDKPLVAFTASGGTELLENVTRVENFGAQQVHWVEIAVDPRDENVFRVTPHIVGENVFPR